MASYQDPMLMFTLNDAVAKAAYPERLRFGVVDQHAADQRAQIAALPFGALVRYVHLDPQDTLGVCWARALGFSLYDGEDFLLQVDSHTLFEPRWDEQLLAQHAALRSRCAKPIISTYPYRFDLVDGQPVHAPQEDRTVLVLRPHPDTTLSADDLVLRFQGRHLFTDGPVRGCHIAGGFVFCAGRFVEEVPYDPYLYFHGEEQSLSVRAFTRGWDIYHPLHIPLYHLYKQANVAHAEHHWHGAVDARRAFSSAYLTERAKLRLKRLLTGQEVGTPYGLGTQRSLAAFAQLSGIDYLARSIRDCWDGRLA
nr:GlcNAc-transferase family protein [Massilia sp. TS11]